jgi:hypothetical protein
MKTILLLAIPPAAGAVIGFITNVIAIKMLFRPLKEIRVFGIRLPFTPGLLPRQRHKLADNIGAMVERELLTPEILRGRMRREEVREGIARSVSRYTEKIFGAALEDLLDSAPASPLRDFGFSLIQGFVSSPVCDELIDLFSAALADRALAGNWAALSIRDLAGTEGAEKITSLAERVIFEKLSGGAERIAGSLSGAAEGLYPRIAGEAIRFLNRPDIREQLEERGRVFISRVILKLNVFQRFFISTAQYDKTLHERMPEIIDDLVSQLEELLQEEGTRRKLLQWARESFVRTFSDEQKSRIAAHSLALVLSAQLDKPLGHLFQNPGAGELGDLIRSVLNRLKERMFLTLETGDSGPRSLFSTLSARIRKRYGTVSLGGVLSLGPEKKAALDALVAAQILRIADEQAAQALGAINIRAMVAERINGLDMIRVERIVLDVMAHQLKWIDVFGAILGFLIGLSQSLFSWIFR